MRFPAGPLPSPAAWLPFLLLLSCEISEDVPGQVSTVSIKLYNYTEIDPYEGVLSMNVVMELNGEEYISSFFSYPPEEGALTFPDLKEGGVAECFVYGYSDTSGTGLVSFGKSPPFLLFEGLEVEIGIFFGKINRYMRLTSPLENPRYGHTAHLLEEGKVLILGGFDPSGNPLSACEFFDPLTGAFTTAGEMVHPRGYHASTIYRDGEILISGGLSEGGIATATAEVFDPIYETFSEVNSMNEARYYHTLLHFQEDFIYTVMGGSTQEMYNIGNQIFRTTNDPIPDSDGIQSASILSSEAILVTGDQSSNTGIFFWWVDEDNAEDPITSAFVNVSAMNTYRVSPATLTLDGGSILICGGKSVSSNSVIQTCETFSIETRGFIEATPLLRSRMGHRMTPYDSGRILITGGRDQSGNVPPYTEFYNISNGERKEFLQNSERYEGTTTVLPDGSVLLTGGFDFSTSCESCGTAEILIPYLEE